MKKILTLVLAVLLAVSLVSCQGDKSEEMDETFASYMGAVETTGYACFAFGDALGDAGSATEAVTLDLANVDESKISLTALIGDLVLDDEHWAANTTIKSKKGTIEGTYSDNGDKDLTFKGVEVSLTYQKAKGSDKDSNVETITITIDGTFKQKTVQDKSESAEVKLTINGKSYNYETVTEVDAETGKSVYKSATINGKSVNLTVLNNYLFSD